MRRDAVYRLIGEDLKRYESNRNGVDTLTGRMVLAILASCVLQTGILIRLGILYTRIRLALRHSPMAEMFHCESQWKSFITSHLYSNRRKIIIKLDIYNASVLRWDTYSDVRCS